MPIKLAPDSFLNGLRQSQLVQIDRLDKLLLTMRAEGVSMHDAESIAEALVDREVITRWQADKLLQGKFKGFRLGNYRLRKLLGKGEMSSVYLAEHAMMKRLCAIKVLPAIKVKDTSYLGRFQREAEAVASLDHPNIVRAYDVGMEVEAGTDIHYLVMEYVEGKSLEARRNEQNEISIVEAAEYIRQAALGLAHAHENGLVHRDVKPGNLLIDNKGVVRILDLGLARFFKSTDEESLTIKHDEKVLGTADYLAPEQAVDSHNVDERADIYSLGCTFYFALAGEPPFTDGTLVQRLLAHQTKAPPPLRRHRADIPDSLAAIVDRLLKKRKDDRFQTMKEVADALGRWLVEHAPRAWKEAHPEVVASLTGIETLQSPGTNLAIQERLPEGVKPAELKESVDATKSRLTPPITRSLRQTDEQQKRDSGPRLSAVAENRRYTLPPPVLATRRRLARGLNTQSSAPSLPINRTMIGACALVVAAIAGVAGIVWKLNAGVELDAVEVETPGEIEIGHPAQ